jgi:hypothetical protein
VFSFIAARKAAEGAGAADCGRSNRYSALFAVESTIGVGRLAELADPEAIGLSNIF